MRPRKTFIAGNWKMNLTSAGAVDLANAVADYAKKNAQPSMRIAVFPPSVYLAEIAALLQGSQVAVGAQNLYFENAGAFTGEISASMIKDVGASMVLIGHSERRHVFAEKPEWMGKKLRAALAQGLKPILCIGEKIQEREQSETQDVIKSQLQALEGIAAQDMERMSIAYEPVWAIGTGRNATPEQAAEVHQYIRNWLEDLFGSEIAQNLCIQYGGSVTPENAPELLAQPEIDGFLVGGASLHADKFSRILASAKV